MQQGDCAIFLLFSETQSWSIRRISRILSKVRRGKKVQLYVPFFSVIATIDNKNLHFVPKNCKK